MSGTVIVKICCQLGNQMCQIAAAYSFAKKYNKILKYTVAESDLTMEGTAHYKHYDYITNMFEFVKESDIDDSFVRVTENNHQDIVDLDSYGECENVYMQGYFQSPLYYNKEIILDLFKVTENEKRYIAEKYGDLSSATCLQLRIGADYVYDKNFISPSFKYFSDMYNKYFSGSPVLISSDSINLCKQFIFGDKIIFLDDEPNPVMALKIMACCKNFIISPSTFGFWAGYIGACNNGNVICPVPWFKSDKELRVENRGCNDWIKENVY